MRINTSQAEAVLRAVSTYRLAKRWHTREPLFLSLRNGKKTLTSCLEVAMRVQSWLDGVIRPQAQVCGFCFTIKAVTEITAYQPANS